jgi:hypothetical protein
LSSGIVAKVGAHGKALGIAPADTHQKDVPPRASAHAVRSCILATTGTSDRASGKREIV